MNQNNTPMYDGGILDKNPHTHFTLTYLIFEYKTNLPSNFVILIREVTSITPLLIYPMYNTYLVK